jgi:hypothetical protein
MIGVVKTATGEVVITNVVTSSPGATVTVAGTLAASDELDRLIVSPLTPAFAVSRRMPSIDVPPSTCVALKAIEPTQAVVDCCGLMVSGAVTEFADFAVMFAVVVDETGVVDIGNVVLAEPCGTNTDAGTVAAGLSLERLTGTPPAGADALSVTVPVAPCPPVTLGGEMVRLTMVPVFPPPPPPFDGLMVRFADMELADVAVIVAVV